MVITSSISTFAAEENVDYLEDGFVIADKAFLGEKATSVTSGLITSSTRNCTFTGQHTLEVPSTKQKFYGATRTSL